MNETYRNTQKPTETHRNLQRQEEENEIGDSLMKIKKKEESP